VASDCPHDHLLDRVDRLSGLGGELGKGAVVVEAQHRGEVLARRLGALFIAMWALVLAGLPTRAP